MSQKKIYTFHDKTLDEKFVSGKDVFTGKLLKVKSDTVSFARWQRNF
jgi:hypothetical protein